MKHGEVWQVDFAPAVGQEIKKQRPAVIVNHNSVGSLNLKIVVPISEVTKPSSWHVPLSPSSANGLIKACHADCFGLKSISHDRFIKKLGKLSDDEMDEVKLGLVLVLDIIP
jgi:mRNA interferase MazF